MAAHRIPDEPDPRFTLIHLTDLTPWMQPAGEANAPGVWAARLRFTLEEPLETVATFESTRDFELFVDGDSIVRSPSGRDPSGGTLDYLRLELRPGRHELFAYLWSFHEGAAPAFRFASADEKPRLETGAAPWTAAPLTNVQVLAPGRGGVAVVGEPTGPNGMDRGAEWQPIVPETPVKTRGLVYEPVALRPISPNEVRGVDGSDEGVQSVLTGEGSLSLSAGEERTLRLELPREGLFTRVRASGGVGSSVEIRCGGEGDIFGPRGFRQDFASFTPISGGETEVILRGGDRGTALFRLEFSREVRA